MKIDPLNILLNKDFKANKKFYFVSGNEATLIQRIIREIINSYQINENAALKKRALSSFFARALSPQMNTTKNKKNNK